MNGLAAETDTSGIEQNVNDIAYVGAIETIRQATTTCAACAKASPALYCRDHISALTTARRERTASLLRSPAHL